MRVIVVGAGLAGLAAVCRLRDRDHEVVLVERSRLLGGKATSFTVDGVEVDNGQHVHLECCTEYLDFVDRLGMTGRCGHNPCSTSLCCAPALGRAGFVPRANCPHR